MLGRLRAARRRALDTLWFVPTLMVAGALALAGGMVELSAHVDAAALARWPRLFGAGADGSRAMLGAIAGGMISVAGLGFSLTMVAVTQASAQFTPRVLRNFIRDRANQATLGTLVGVFAYCLVVLRAIRGGDEGRFVPSLAVGLGIVLAVVGVAVLIFFAHHIASTLQASSVVARVSRETLAAVDALYPDPLGAGDDTPAPPPAGPHTTWRPVPARATGYVEAVDAEALARAADEAGAVVRMTRGVGDFVTDGATLAEVSGGAAGDTRLGRRVARAYTLGEYRAVAQDAEFGVRQLVDVALKALSPGVNDTTTAASCVDHLGAVLLRLADRRVARPPRAAAGGGRLVERGATYEGMLRLAVDEVRASAEGNAAALDRLLGMLADVTAGTPSPARRALLAEQVALVREAAARTVAAPYDRARLLARADAAARAARAADAAA